MSRQAVFLSGGVSECNLDHRQPVAMLFMLFKIKRNPVQTSSDRSIKPLIDAMPLPYALAGVTRGALVAHIYRHSNGPLLCRTSAV